MRYQLSSGNVLVMSNVDMEKYDVYFSEGKWHERINGYANEMTLTDEETDPVNDAVDDASNSSGGSAEVSVKSREKPFIHLAVDPPLCHTCQKLDLTFFDPSCPGCSGILANTEQTGIPEIFAILRQWTPQSQQNIETLIKEILQRGANPNDRDGLTDMTLLHFAAKAGAHGMGDATAACKAVNLLISSGADVFIRCRWTNMSALHYAAYFDCPAVIRVLLKASRGIDIDCTCSEFDHGAALHIAASNLAFEAAKCLIQNGANVCIKDDHGRTPYDVLPDSGHPDTNSESGRLALKMKKMLSEAEPATPKKQPANYDLVPGKVTLRALGIELGERVVVGGAKHGTLRYCGPTEFAAGIWAGVELDDPVGKNDGTVGNISYFACPLKYGIFAPMSKLTREGMRPLGSPSKSSPGVSPVRQHQRVDVSHVGAKVDTGLNHGRTSSYGSELGTDLELGDRVVVAGQRKGIIKYIGETKFSPGTWYGIELDHAVGRNNGTVNGVHYFTCQPKHGVFAPPSRVKPWLASILGSNESLDTYSQSLDQEQQLQQPKDHRLSGGFKNASGSLTSLQSSPSRASTATSSRPQSTGNMQRRHGRQAQPDFSGDLKLRENLSVFCNGELGVIKYIGPTDFAEGVWVGVELRVPKGKNDGSVQGTRYFTCKPDHGLLVRPSKVTCRGINGAKLLGDVTQYLER
ncbi:CAP-Gly domain-containing linker protein 3-like isoform X2 [Lineus longissimus]|uniref:CAP-Gly domain-containing linker protein 3-like isoform X2 n=1 Tax=Lineus longissimus TaxID=88925 RepID=UPI00315CA420